MNRKTSLGYFLVLISLTCVFFVGSANASGTVFIKADGSIVGTDKITSSDNITYTLNADLTDSIVIARNNIVFDGNGRSLNGPMTLTSLGFTLEGVSGVTIKNTIITGYVRGIFLSSNSTDNILTGNTITSVGGFGIWVYASSDRNTISGNFISNSSAGIYISDYSSNNIITGNQITSNTGAGGSGIVLNKFANQNTITDNTITNNINGGLGIGTYSDGNIIARNEITYNIGTGIIVDSSNNSQIRDNNVTSNSMINGSPGYGIAISGSSNNTSITGNNIISNGAAGIFVQNYANNTKINANLISLCESGVYVGASNTAVTGNTVTSNTHQGICLFNYATNDSVTRNVITECEDGIYLDTSNGNIILNNNVTSNTANGIFLTNSASNTLYGNIFIGNTRQANTDDRSANTWDNGSKGNYWSDYNGTDANNDGIGDTPYVIDVNNQDRYPIAQHTPLPSASPAPTLANSPSQSPSEKPTPSPEPKTAQDFTWLIVGFAVLVAAIILAFAFLAKRKSKKKKTQ